MTARTSVALCRPSGAASLVAMALGLSLTAPALAHPQSRPASTTQPRAGAEQPETKSNREQSPGELVSEIDKSCWIVFQDNRNDYWFGSDGHGVCRYDGKVITRVTTAHGLCNDHVRGIQQHARSGDILIATNGGVSKFDGHRMTTLTATEMNPALPPDEGWSLNPDDVWLIGAAGPRRYDGKTLYQLKFPKSPLHDELVSKYPDQDKRAPQDVWTVYKDRKGHIWFGTGVFGICRFDGRSLDWMYERHLTAIAGGGWFGFRSIIEDRRGDFWFCNTQFRYRIEPHGATDDGKLRYARESGIDLAGSATSDKFIYYQSIAEDNNHDLWMAPYAGGVWRYDGKSVTHYPMRRGAEEITMFSIYKDNRGDIWVGTHENGAYRFTGKAFERFSP